jgi:type II secretion system protein L
LNTLRIYFSAQWQGSATPCPWALCDDAGQVLQQGLSTLATMPKNRDCIGILAADRVLIFTTATPPGNKRRWPRALPFIAEEYALTDPDDIHAVPATGTASGTIAVSVTAKSWLKQIVAAAAEAGLPLRCVVAETLMPVLQSDSWTLIWDGQSGFLRTSLTTGLALDSGDTQTPPHALQLSLAAAGENLPRQIELRCIEPATSLPAWHLPIPLVAGAPWDWQRAPISVSTPNLLWGELTPPIRLFDGLSKLRPLLFILLAAFSIEVAGTHIEWFQLAHEKNTLTNQIDKIFHSTFGDDSTLVDAPLQTQRNLAALRHAAGMSDDADFLPLLDNAAPALSTAVHSLNYESGKLELDIKLAKAADLESLEKNLRNRGLRVRTSDMHDQGNGIQAKLTLTLEGLR